MQKWTEKSTLAENWLLTYRNLLLNVLKQKPTQYHLPCCNMLKKTTREALFVIFWGKGVLLRPPGGYPEVKPQVLICCRCICDIATGTAWDTSWTNENLCCRQLKPSQSSTTGTPAKLNLSQLSGMLEVKTGITNITGHSCSYVRKVSQAVERFSYDLEKWFQ